MTILKAFLWSDMLVEFVASDFMVPEQRLKTLLDQALAWQIHNCVWHNRPANETFSLFKDHVCDRYSFNWVAQILANLKINFPAQAKQSRISFR